MASSLTKRDLEHLAKLARIELDPKEEETLLRDLGNILDHFKELQALDTTDVAGVTGGTDLKNVFRDREVDRFRLAHRRFLGQAQICADLLIFCFDLREERLRYLKRRKLLSEKPVMKLFYGEIAERLHEVVRLLLKNRRDF